MRDIRQIQIAHAGVAVAQHDAGALLVGPRARGQKQIAGEPDALAVKIDALAAHLLPPSAARALARPNRRPRAALMLRCRFVSTSTVAVMPARRVDSLSCGNSRIFTGSRCTTLTQFPEAFCGGKIANSEPAAGLMLATSPSQASSG